MKKLIIIGILLSITNLSFSEDIELYVTENPQESENRPQVLIIFDNSVSMADKEYVNKPYNPNVNYGAVSPHSKASNNYIYYSKGLTDVNNIPIADNINEKRKFPLAINNCKAAQNLIEQFGFYTGHVREYQFQSNSGHWTELNEADGTGIIITDCEDDVLNVNNANENYLNNTTTAIASAGYPVDGEGKVTAPKFYTNNVNDSNVKWTGSLITLYSDNYLRWYHGANLAQEWQERIAIAQESISNLITTSPNVDFGLQVFNYNFIDENTRDGGRIVFGIKKSTLANRTALLDIINNKITPETNTPLCESLYEASRYFGGAAVDFGNNDSDYNLNGYVANQPDRDFTIITSSNTYQSPFKACSNKAYVILITDGEPSKDKAADTKIKALGSADNYVISAFDDNYLPALAGWMNNNDVNKHVDGKQTVSTYTIGFSQDSQAVEPLLEKTAELGGGKYFSARDTASLTAALSNVLNNLEPSNNSLTSASVAVNNFNRTETLNSVYYATFQPKRGARWQGNLKKYKIKGEQQVGKNGNAAIDASTGNFSPDVTSFWSVQKDGDQLEEGGVADMLRKKTSRVIYSDIGGGQGDSLALFTLAKLTSSSNFYKSASALAIQLTVNENDIEEHIKWAQGIDVDDEDGDGITTDMRRDVFGDPLHSKPLVINYGDKIHILVGTNAGALHMFQDGGDQVDETWAFMPKEFFPNIKTLRKNSPSDNKVYGVDGNITSYIDDKDGDGIIESGDKVWIFFGLRRGGNTYYGLDISNPNSPSLLWRINGSTSGFKELGQTWSQPKVAYSKLNIVGGAAKPVLFFGGGYDISKDNKGVGRKDNIGRAIYMVDAKTGTLKWSMAESNATTYFAGQHSIPSSIATLDSDGDGLVDRLYTGDTGGHVWRIDMPSNNPTGADPWTVLELASLSEGTSLTDRRFFSEPAIVRTFISETLESNVKSESGNVVTTTSHQEIPYDAILLGSGDRSNPLGTDTNDMFFMIKDKYIVTQSFNHDSAFTMPETITKAELFDITDNPIENENNDNQLTKLKVDLSSASGWFFNLTQSGEKNTASAIVINNTVYFTSFTPPNLTQNNLSCNISSGQGWLYAVDLASGVKKFNWATESSNNRENRIAFIGEQFLGTPTIIKIPKSPDNQTLDTIGNLIVGLMVVPINFKIQTMRTYLYVTEEQ